MGTVCWTGGSVRLAAMRILPILILALMAIHSGSARRQSKRTKDKGPCGKPFLKEINGKCYYVAVKKINWFGAQNNCLRKGLNLADVSTPEDFHALVRHMEAQVGMDDFWFGGNDLQTEGRFTYISSGRLVRYMGDDGMVEPTHRSNMDDCLEIRIRPNRTVVLDVNCQEKKYFVCERSQEKCAVPAEETSGDGQHHSHEHLHHFHHDAAKKEKQEAGTERPSVESDSRPADNSNSTEVGSSEEAEGGEVGAGTDAEAGAEGAAPAGEGGAPAEGGAAEGAEGAGTEPAEGAATTAPPAEGAAAGTAAPAEGAATPAGEATTPAAAAVAPPAEGGATTAAPA
ncbi:uncharacterized protein LOC108090869 [Drosophila ficusphila]|uniref:uncharacterized protein LOC108090869 n=1 Tax=Drosophila ficusphila TaxID=30025 RepID=UPI0007E7C368|nr:uncharacterized protein LOC108090869 [Drosophila ficusphila]